MSQRFDLPRYKDPYEAWFAQISIAAWLGGETISQVNFTAVDEDGNDVSTTFLDAAKCTYSAAILKPYIQGGTDGVRYYVTMKVITATDPSKDVFVLMVPVKNIL